MSNIFKGLKDVIKNYNQFPFKKDKFKKYTLLNDFNFYYINNYYLFTQF